MYIVCLQSAAGAFAYAWGLVSLFWTSVVKNSEWLTFPFYNMLGFSENNIPLSNFFLSIDWAF